MALTVATPDLAIAAGAGGLAGLYNARERRIPGGLTIAALTAVLTERLIVGPPIIWWTAMPSCPPSSPRPPGRLADCGVHYA